MEKSAAFYAGVEAGFDKEAIWPFKPKNVLRLKKQTHRRALGLGTTQRGAVKTTTKVNPKREALGQQWTKKTTEPIDIGFTGWQHAGAGK